MPLAAGTRLGPYAIVAPLGAGGMGEVFRARDTRLSRDVAIKALPEAFASSPELALGTQIAAAIEAAHERGVVHRNLKPGNVMLTPAGAAKVLDFGLAKSDPTLLSGGNSSESPTATAHAGATMAGTILGTVAYMSPEQARGKPVDRRSDVWSFGCVLFECLAGTPAFAGETSSDLIARILEREPDWSALPSYTPPRVREILRRCLCKDTEARPRDIRDVRLELADATAGGARADAGREQSVAVLPFDNLSGSDHEYFADGVTDEILNRLAHLEGLRVAARTSCFAFKGRREDLRAIGERLDVATVLEGSVRRSGTRLRITAQLVKVADGYQLWSERYDREMTDVFEVQDEIANAIATRLRGTLYAEAERGHARKGTTDLEAFELLLKCRTLQAKRGRFLPEAIACFERAIELDPRYAKAIAWLSDSHRLMGTFGVAPFSEVMPKAKGIAERALAIDPDLAEAWVTLASIAEQPTRPWRRRSGRAASGRHPWAMGTLAWTYGKTGQAERAVAIRDELEARSRFEFMSPFWRAVAASSSGLPDEAIHFVERGVAEHDPLVGWGRITPLWGAIRAHPKFDTITRGVWA